MSPRYTCEALGLGFYLNYSPPKPRMLELIKNKLRPSDLILYVYIAAITRQFFWGVEAQWVAWPLTAFVSAAAVLAHASLREPAENYEEGSGLPGWASALIACSPVAIIYAIRFAVPDHNFDVLNYHLEHMERGLRGWPFLQGDFFPTGVQINPVSDMAMGIVKYALGYRLGTALNFGAMVWTASLALRVLRESIPSFKLRYVAATYVVSTEIILYLLSTYQVDLLTLPLLLEAALLTVNYDRQTRKNYALVHVGLFLGIALAFKLTNLAFIIPIGAVLCYQAYRFGNARTIHAGLLPSAVALIVPAMPFLLFMWTQTGNPTFPYYNKLFHSPFWDASNIEDPTHGPKKLLELALWPFWVYIYPERGSEFVGGDSVYTGRIALGFVFGLVSLFAPGLKPYIRKLGLIAAGSTILWSASSGNLRYGLFLEIIGGVVTLCVLAALLQNMKASEGTRNRTRRVALLSTFIVLFCMQVSTSYRQAATLNQSLFGDKVQLTIFQAPRLYLTQLPHILKDRTAKTFLHEAERKEVESAEVWINSYPTSASIMSSLRPEIPMISVTPFLADVSIYSPLMMEAGRIKCAQAISMARGKRLYSITQQRNQKEAIENLQKAGLRPAKMTNFAMPFYSSDVLMDLTLIEVEIDNGASIQIPDIRR